MGRTPLTQAGPGRQILEACTVLSIAQKGTVSAMRRLSRGFTIIELLVVVSIIALLVGILLPAIGKARDNAMVNVSKNNLRQLGIAHATYGADWADRHVTLLRDNLGQYGGDVEAYNGAIYGSTQTGFDVHPPIIAGWGYTAGGAYQAWAYWSTSSQNVPLFQPINLRARDWGRPDTGGHGLLCMPEEEVDRIPPLRQAGLSF